LVRILPGIAILRFVCGRFAALQPATVFEIP